MVGHHDCEAPPLWNNSLYRQALEDLLASLSPDQTSDLAPDLAEERLKWLAGRLRDAADAAERADELLACNELLGLAESLLGAACHVALRGCDEGLRTRLWLIEVLAGTYLAPFWRDEDQSGVDTEAVRQACRYGEVWE